MTGLGCRLMSLTFSSYSGRLMLFVLGKGLKNTVQVHVLSYPVKASRFLLWLNAESRLNFSWLCSRPISALYCSLNSALSLTYRISALLFTYLASFTFTFGVFIGCPV